MWQTGAEVLAASLRLLHPVMPFVTEEIWAALGPAVDATDELLITAPWPRAGDRDAAAEEAFERLAEVVRVARNLRTEARVPAGAKVALHLAPVGPEAAAAIEAGRRYLEPLARVHLEVMPPGAPGPAGGGAATALGAAWLDEREAPRQPEPRSWRRCAATGTRVRGASR